MILNGFRMSNRDNVVFRSIFGNFYKERWTRNCMEASFYVSGDVEYRPLRRLYVNAFSEMNFFRTGVMAGRRGRIIDVI